MTFHCFAPRFKSLSPFSSLSLSLSLPSFPLLPLSLPQQAEKEKDAQSGIGSAYSSGDLEVDNDDGFTIIESVANDDDMVVECLPNPSKKREREVEEEDTNSSPKR